MNNTDAIDRLGELAEKYARQAFDLEWNLRDELWSQLDLSIHEFNHGNEPRQMYWNGYSTAIRHVIKFLNDEKLSLQSRDRGSADDPWRHLQRQPKGSAVPDQREVASGSDVEGADQGAEQKDGVEVRQQQVSRGSGHGAGQGSTDADGYIPFNAEDQ